jgi:hypothetical protein
LMSSTNIRSWISGVLPVGKAENPAARLHMLSNATRKTRDSKPCWDKQKDWSTSVFVVNMLAWCWFPLTHSTESFPPHVSPMHGWPKWRRQSINKLQSMRGQDDQIFLVKGAYPRQKVNHGRMWTTTSNNTHKNGTILVPKKVYHCSHTYFAVVHFLPGVGD